MKTNGEMKYSDVLNMISDGDTLFISNPFKFSKPATWMSTIIRAIAKTPNHSAIFFLDNRQEFNCYGAKSHGVKVTTLASEIINNVITIKRKNSDNIKVKRSWCTSMLNHPYDFEGLLFFQLVNSIFKIWLGPKGEKAKNKFYCYEYTADANKYPKADGLNAIEYYNWSQFTTVIENIKITKS